MRRITWLLAVAAMCALPGRVLADSHLSSDDDHYPPCGIYATDDNASAYRHLRCLAGVAVKVSPSSMKVRPTHGSQLRVRFTNKTLFATDSGEGVLDGLIAGDYVCVSYTPHPGTMTALVVVFDPVSSPCGSGKHLRLLISRFPDGRRWMTPPAGYTGCGPRSVNKWLSLTNGLLMDAPYARDA
jgi:hypothetical protein